ncbi:MAG: hypothetical protein VB092_03780 [Oscillospiraceae bacterium]|nr:hypothetical protein [Oscillospiraceae bacterium]
MADKSEENRIPYYPYAPDNASAPYGQPYSPVSGDPNAPYMPGYTDPYAAPYYGPAQSAYSAYAPDGQSASYAPAYPAAPAQSAPAGQPYEGYAPYTPPAASAAGYDPYAQPYQPPTYAQPYVPPYDPAAPAQSAPVGQPYEGYAPYTPPAASAAGYDPYAQPYAPAYQPPAYAQPYVPPYNPAAPAQSAPAPGYDFTSDYQMPDFLKDYQFGAFTSDYAPQKNSFTTSYEKRQEQSAQPAAAPTTAQPVQTALPVQSAQPAAAQTTAQPTPAFDGNAFYAQPSFTATEPARAAQTQTAQPEQSAQPAAQPTPAFDGNAFFAQPSFTATEPAQAAQTQTAQPEQSAQPAAQPTPAFDGNVFFAQPSLTATESAAAAPVQTALPVQSAQPAAAQTPAFGGNAFYAQPSFTATEPAQAAQAQTAQPEQSAQPAAAPGFDENAIFEQPPFAAAEPAEAAAAPTQSAPPAPAAQAADPFASFPGVPAQPADRFFDPGDAAQPAVKTTSDAAQHTAAQALERAAAVQTLPQDTAEVEKVAQEMSSSVLSNSYSKIFSDNNLSEERRGICLRTGALRSDYFLLKQGGRPYRMFDKVSLTLHDGSCAALLSDVEFAGYVLAKEIGGLCDAGDEDAELSETQDGDLRDALYIGGDEMLPEDMASIDYLLLSQQHVDDDTDDDPEEKLGILLSQMGLGDIEYENTQDLTHNKRIFLLLLSAAINPYIGCVIVNDPQFRVGRGEDTVARRIFAKLAGEGKGVLLASCGSGLMASVANRVIALRAGQIVFDDTYKRFLDKYCLGIMSFTCADPDAMVSFFIQKYANVSALSNGNLVYLLRKHEQDVDLDALLTDAIRNGADHRSIVLDEKSFDIACKEVLRGI